MKLANSRLLLYGTLAATRFFGRYSARLAGVPARLLWFTPWRVPVSERGLRKQARWLEQTHAFTLRTGMGRLSGCTAGDGPPVILVHGWGERAAGLGGFIAPLTDAGFQVIGFDLPAHGASAGQMSHPLDAAAALREVADHFGGVHAVIAHSLGATAALLAMSGGLAVNRAVLIAPNVDSTSALNAFQRMFGLPDKAMAGLRRNIERRFGPSIWRDIDGERLAASIETPAVVFHDPDDAMVPYVGSERLVRVWAGSKLIPAAGLGHGAITRDPSVIEAAVAFVGSSEVGLRLRSGDGQQSRTEGNRAERGA